MGGSEFVGALDLGGASTQLAFSTTAPDDAAPPQQVGAVQTVAVPGVGSYRVYAVSRLGYGVHEAFQSYLKFAVTGTATARQDRPLGRAARVADVGCLPRGLSKVVELGSGTDGHVVVAEGTGDAGSCEASVAAFLSQSERHGNRGGVGVDGAQGVTRALGLEEVDTFYAFDNFFKTAALLAWDHRGGGAAPPSSPPLPTLHASLAQIRAWSIGICSRGWGVLQQRFSPRPSRKTLERACFAGLYIVRLLEDVYGLGPRPSAASPNQLNLVFADQIAGFDGSWSLGAMVDNVQHST